MVFRKYFTAFVLGIVFFAIPDYSKLQSPIIRFSLLILAPLLSWFAVGFIWKYFSITNRTEIVLNKVLSGLISFAFLVLAILECFKTTHFENTETIRTSNGLEDVGDYISVPGPNVSFIILFLIFSFLFFWFGVVKYKMQNQSK
jgi:hypothetical protein